MKNMIYKAAQGFGTIVCYFKGCHYDAPFFHTNALYFCTRCGKEITGRTWDDIEPMTDEDLETLAYFDEHYLYEERT